MKKGFLLSAASLALFAGIVSVPAAPAHAGEETGTLMYYPLSDSERQADYYGWKHYIEYNVYREPCQHYVEPPGGYRLENDCHIQRFVPHMASAESVTTIAPAAGEPAPAPVAAAPAAPYMSTIYFDFDKSNIRGSEQDALNNLINEIKNENPAQIVIEGHADRAGSEEYNIGLSQRRAQTVANALAAQGVRQDIIDQKAYGESRPAVPTADGVPLQQNRRAVIELNR